jgi:DNA-binding MarR family transcriptional regulator
VRSDLSVLFDLFVTGQRVRRILTDAMAPSGMKPDEYAVYSVIVARGPLTATQMSDLLGMPLSTVLDYLKSMRAAGHLERIAHPNDGRAVQVRLSPSGLKAFQRGHHHFEKAFQPIARALSMPLESVRLAIAALDEAAREVGAIVPADSSAGQRFGARPRPRGAAPPRARRAAADRLPRARG